MAMAYAVPSHLNFVPSGEGSFALPFGCMSHGTAKGDSWSRSPSVTIRHDTTRNANV